MLMRRFALLLILSTTSTIVPAQSWRLDRARLCFTRWEDNGRMNIVESWVRISDYRVPLVGGQAACIFVDPGSSEVRVTSTMPYQPTRNEEACMSRVIKLDLAPNENRLFKIWPASKGSTYVCGWHIQQVQPGMNKSKKADRP